MQNGTYYIKDVLHFSNFIIEHASQKGQKPGKISSATFKHCRDLLHCTLRYPFRFAGITGVL